MLQKIINVLDRIETTPLYSIISNVSLNSVLKITGIQLSSGVGQLKISNFKAGEIRALLTALEYRDVTYLKHSELCRSLYALITFEDIKILTNKTDVLPELTGSVAEAIDYEVMLECLDVVFPPTDKLVEIKDIEHE